MKSFRIIVIGTFLLLGIVFPQSAFAATTQFRSAQIITTDGATAYTNLANCSATDGATCDRASGASFGNLYFRNFGTYADFGIPTGSTITHARIRVTGKTTAAIFVGLSNGTVFSANCQFPSNLWTLSQLSGQTIKTQTFVTPLAVQFQPATVSSHCLQQFNFDNASFIWRINFSTAQNWSANIDNFEIAFDYETPPTPSKTPLILIPGIGGSELLVLEDTTWSQPDGHGGTFSHIYPRDEIVWVNNGEAAQPGNDDYFDVLRMQSDGLTSEANIGLTGNLFAGAYQETIAFFESNGYEENVDLFVFPYDWRKDISLTAPLLDAKIAAIKTQTGSDQVDIVAHSMGGLVARNYIADPSRAQNVRKLFTLGTPHLGSIQFLKALHYGIQLDPVFLLGLIKLSPSAVKDVLQNTISGYSLAPSQKYFDFYDGSTSNPFPFRDDADIDNDGVTGDLNYGQIRILLAHLGHNTSLFTQSELLHGLDNSLANTNGVEVYIISGSGVSTLGQIIERNIIDFVGVTISKKDEIFINGDETVPLYSSSLNDIERSISFSGDAKIYYTKQKHGGLVSTGPAMQLIKNILSDETTLPIGVSTQPYALSGTQLSVHSPVNLHVYDGFSRHTGPTPDGDFETDIPGSSYETLDDAKFIFLPDGGQYRVEFQATGEGSFDFKIRNYEDDVNTKTVLYKNIPLDSSTKAQADVDTNSPEVTLLQIDQDGDSVIDSQKNPDSILQGDSNFDFTPPIITINIPQKNQFLTLSKIINADFGCLDEASGVDKCIGAVDLGQNVDTTSVGSKSFRVYSEDKAGNAAELIYDYKVVYATNGLCSGQPGHSVLQPINADGTSIFKQGSTIPVKFRICDSNGVSVGSAGVVNGFSLIKVVSGTLVNTVNEPVVSTTPDAGFRWDPKDQQWMFNMSTKNLSAGKTYFYRIGLNDASSIEFSFGLR